MKPLLSSSIVAVIVAGSVSAQGVNIAQDMPEVSFSVNGRNYVISRIQDPESQLNAEFTKTSRKCPPFCIQPISAGQGIATVGEIEVIEFLKNDAQNGAGLLIDVRMPERYEKGSIPAAINIPISALEESNPYRDEILAALGAEKADDIWDFGKARDLVLFCEGPWSAQSSSAIKSMLKAGYPAEKIKYYRGGMQLWLLLGLTTTTPGK